MVKTPAQNVWFALFGIVLLFGCVGCQPAAPPPGETWLPQLAGGELLRAGTWIDFRQRFAEEQSSAAILPPVHLATIEGEWGGAESWGAWGVGERSTFRFFLRWQQATQLYIRCRAVDDPQGRRQTVEVIVNGQEVTHLDIGLDWEEQRIDLPEGLLQLGDNRVELIYGFHVEGRPGVDPRPLALAIEEIGLLQSGQKPKPLRNAAEDLVEIDTDKETLRLLSSGTYLTPIRVPRNAVALELAIGLSGRGTQLRASIMTTDGSEEVLFESDEHSKSERHRLPLQSYRGRDAFLAIDTELGQGGTSSLSYPRLLEESTSTPELSRADRTAAQPNTVARPDVVVIVLDAARADRFGSYGYERNTTPFIDRLATEALVFDTAIAECPYTVCSMPQLLAGLSFLQHGLVARTHRLADETQTLAEILSQLGYQTLAFTGNPNSSRATGSDQGFDEFHEIWRLTSGRDRTHPGFLTDRAIKRFETLDSRPLFVMLHYVPPHEPYDPDPEFDLFGDPAYDGPVTGDQQFVQAAFTRQVELDPADLDELSALYDGNLRMADDYVRRLVEALQAAGRWDNTLFVLTSDHGEAFAEHGVLGHNETLYEEMLRVPLILRLPGGQRPSTAELTQLASLGDVMPTVLARLDYPPPVGAFGSDLLSPRNDADRHIVLRSSHEAGTIFGVRTQRWKLMARSPASWDPGWFRLFDLEADPDERVDLAAQHRLIQAALALRLSQALQSQQPAQTESGTIPETDEEMLKSLGYL